MQFLPKEIIYWFQENDVDFFNLIPYYDIENDNLIKKNVFGVSNKGFLNAFTFEKNMQNKVV